MRVRVAVSARDSCWRHALVRLEGRTPLSVQNRRTFHINMAASATSDVQTESIFSKFSNAISAAYKRLVGTYESSIRCGKTAFDMPCYPLVPFHTSVMASCTGPYGGICQLEPDKDAPTHDPGESIAGVVHWHRPQPHADGDSITLYEHKGGSTHHHGDPIADVYAVLSRPNSCVLAVADGCGWGIKPRLAARCAVHGCMDHLNAKLFNSLVKQITTQDVFLAMFRSLHTAQKCIIDHGGTTTTLCLAVVVELTDPKAMNKWGVCVVSVGDSLCYVWRNETQEVYEVTSAIREGKERNPRDAGGCLGADLGDHPDLSNLHCCFAPLADNDIIFLCSDGVSDNFDPVTLREAVSESSLEASQASNYSENQPSTPTIPTVTPAQRQSFATEKIARLLRDKWMQKNSLTATEVKECITNFVIEATEEKRKFLEQTWTVSEGVTLSPAEKREQDRRIGQALKQMPGKLDHATIAAFKVGKTYTSISDQDIRRGHSPTHSYYMNTAAADRLPSRRLDSFSVHGGTTFYVPTAQGSKEPKSSRVT